MITTRAKSTIPNDDKTIIISLHSYFPWQFAGEAAVTWGSERDKSKLIAELDKIKQK
jgi:endoglucanase